MGFADTIRKTSQVVKSTFMLLFFGGLFAGAGWFGYSFYKTKMEAQRYREGTEVLFGKYKSIVSEYNTVADRYNLLREKYNDVLARTVITELLITDRKCYVVLRNSEKIIARIDTNVDIKKEIFVDYVLFDNKLFIRRVYDSSMAPENSLDIFNKQIVREALPTAVDWGDRRFKYGKSIYRKLRQGTWVITVTGGGSLDIDRKKNVHHLARLSPIRGVTLKTYKPEELEVLRKQLAQEIQKYSEKISIVDVVKYAFSKRKQLTE